MSRTYDISDFAAFLRKYGDSGRDRGGRMEESGRHDNRRSRPDRDRNQEFRQSQNGYDCSRTTYRVRNREYSLRESEVQAHADVGKFRMLPADDLARFAYGGDRARSHILFPRINRISERLAFYRDGNTAATSIDLRHKEILLPASGTPTQGRAPLGCAIQFPTD